MCVESKTGDLSVYPVWDILLLLALTPDRRDHGFGAIQVLRNADGGEGGVWFSGKKRYEGVMFNVISVTRGWVGVQFPEK